MHFDVVSFFLNSLVLLFITMTLEIFSEILNSENLILESRELYLSD